jgi:HAMP domain-containing protein
VLPEDDIFGAFNLLLYTVIAIGIFGLVTLFILCNLFIRRQLRPLRMLNRSANRVADGHYDEPVPHTEREDEIGQLQYRFRKMQQSLAAHVSELEHLQVSLESQGEILEKSSEQSLENDRMKSTFLHYISNQMIVPGDLIDKSVTKLCNNYHEMSIEDIEKETEIIKQQSTTILQLLGHIIQAMQIDSGKEDSHE